MNLQFKCFTYKAETNQLASRRLPNPTVNRIFTIPGIVRFLISGQVVICVSPLCTNGQHVAPSNCGGHPMFITCCLTENKVWSLHEQSQYSRWITDMESFCVLCRRILSYHSKLQQGCSNKSLDQCAPSIDLKYYRSMHTNHRLMVLYKSMASTYLRDQWYCRAPDIE